MLQAPNGLIKKDSTKRFRQMAHKGRGCPVEPVTIVKVEGRRRRRRRSL